MSANSEMTEKDWLWVTRWLFLPTAAVMGCIIGIGIGFSVAGRPAVIPVSQIPMVVTDADTNHGLAVDLKKPWCWAVTYLDDQGNETIVQHVVYDSPEITIPSPTERERVKFQHWGFKTYLVHCADWHIKVDGQWEPR